MTGEEKGHEAAMEFAGFWGRYASATCVCGCGCVCAVAARTSSALVGMVNGPSLWPVVCGRCRWENAAAESKQISGWFDPAGFLLALGGSRRMRLAISTSVQMG
jgi:hypothetical protein